MQRVDSALDVVGVLNIFVFVFARCRLRIGRRHGGSLLALRGMVRPVAIAVRVLEHAGREAVRGRGELVAAELGHGGLAAGADDQDQLLAPLALLAGHGAVVDLVVIVTLVAIVVRIVVGMVIGIVVGMVTTALVTNL